MPPQTTTDPPSYPPATRDVLSSFTSTSSDSPSERLAEMRERRRATRQARSGSLASQAAAARTTMSSPESLEDEVWHDASLGLPSLRLNHDAASQLSGSVKFQTEDGSPLSTRSINLPAVDHPSSETPSASATAAIPAVASRPSSPIAIAEIPPYRGPRSPTPAAAPSPTSSPVIDKSPAAEAAAAAAAKVKLVDGGVLARMKAARMAKMQGGGPVAAPSSPKVSTETSPPPSPSISLPFDIPPFPKTQAAPSTAAVTDAARASFAEGPITASPPTMTPEVVDSKTPGPSPTKAATARTKEQILSDMRARNAAKAAEKSARGTPPTSTTPLFSPTPAAIPLPDSPAILPPRPFSLRSTSTVLSKQTSPHKNAPTHPPSPTMAPLSPRQLPFASPSQRTEVMHESTPESRSAEINAWLGQSRGTGVDGGEGWDHHSLSEIEEKTEIATMSTRHPSQGRSSHARRPSHNSLPSIVEAPSRAARPLSTRSRSSTGRQLADGSFQVAGTPIPPSPSKRRPAPSLVETAARLLEGYQGSDSQKNFNKETDELRRFVEKQKQRANPPVVDGRRAETDQSRVPSPTRRAVSPELAKKALAFTGGGLSAASSPKEVFGGGEGDDESTWTAQERRQREVERERRKKERETRLKSEQPVIVKTAQPSRPQAYAFGSRHLEAFSPHAPASSTTASSQEGPEIIPPPPVLWEGKIFVPPSSDRPTAALLEPGRWTQRYAVLTSDTLEFRPTDSTGPFSPIVVLFPSGIRRIEKDVKVPPPFEAFRVKTSDGGDHLFGCFDPTDKQNWVLAFEDVANLSRTAHRSNNSILDDISPRKTPYRSPSPCKKSTPETTPSRRREEQVAQDQGIAAIQAATESLRRGVSIKSHATTTSHLASERRKADESIKSASARDPALAAAAPSMPYKDLFSPVRGERPLPDATAPTSDVGVEPVYQPRSLPPSPSKSPQRQQQLPIFPTALSPYTNSRPRSDISRPAQTSPIKQAHSSDQPLIRPTPVRPRRPPSHSTQPAASGLRNRPSHFSLASVLAPRNALELREALHDVLQDTMNLEQESWVQLQSVDRLKDTLAITIRAIDGEADQGGDDFVLFRWQMRDKLFNVYQALKSVERHASIRKQRGDDESLDTNGQPRSLNSSNSKYEEEDLARMDAHTLRMLQELDEEIGDGGDPRFQSFRDGIWTQQAPPEPFDAQPVYEAEYAGRVPLPRPPVRSPQYRPPPSTRPVFDDVATKTTRGAAYSPSEHAAWADDRKHFEDEARLAFQITDSLESSVASPNRKRRERSLAADMLEGRAAEFASPSTSDLAEFSRTHFEPRRAHSKAAPMQSPYAQAIPPTGREGRQPRRGADRGNVVEPVQETSKWSATTSTDGVDERPSHRRAVSEYSTGTARPHQSTQITEVLAGLQAQFRATDDHIADANNQRVHMGQFVQQLADVMNSTRVDNRDQYERLINSVENLRIHLGYLPEQLAHRLREEMTHGHSPGLSADQQYPRSSSAPPRHHTEQQQPVIDDDNGSATTLVDQLEAQAEARMDAAEPNRVRFGINPLSSFAQLDKRMEESGDVLDKDGKLVRKGSTGAKKLRGPRMPFVAGLKMFGGPTPVSTAEHAARWGGGARSLSRAQSNAALDKALKENAEARAPSHGPIVEAIKTDEGLAQALQNLAEGTGENEIDAGTMALAVFEILQSMREISRKQREQEEREKEEKLRNGGLSRKERAELEAKKEEIRRLEQIAQMGGTREAKLDSAILALSEKSNQQDALLQQIAASMEASRAPNKPDLEPLTAETKKLLGQVKAGVDDHVKDFRGQLTSEVQRMFKEVGKLRDEKKTLQTDIAELMSFQAKHGGSSSGGSMRDSAPKPPQTSPLKPGLPTVGFFGPRAMK